MRENILLRFNDHQVSDGVQEFSIEFAVPGRYSRIITGASQVELGMQVVDAFEELFDLFGVPENVERIAATLEAPAQIATAHFFDSEGQRIPVSGFAATAKLAVEAEVYRDGKVVPPEEDAQRAKDAEK